ncbi:CapA family protein [Marinicellulosiphila megalodicopiae]|uniref:CapA family protein n=1 Tax=Marinicellulosiphila megalodicopiae TaxID=2724896 RepID=UPI003BB21747
MQTNPILTILCVAQLVLVGCQTTQVQQKVEPEIEAITPDVQEPQKPLVIVTPTVEPKTITLGFVGDILLAGSAKNTLVKNGYDFPFVNLQSTLDQSDILFGNLEGPLTNFDEIYIEKTYAFRSDPQPTAQALSKAGFDVVSLANNHALDYGWQGLSDTQNVLDEVNIQYVGAGANKTEARAPVIIEKEGIKIGYLAYNNTFPKEFWATDESFGVAYGKQSEFLQDIKKLALISDIQIISFHWGVEGSTNLRGYQTDFARAAIDAGADIVVGHHPHVLQAIEKYNDGLILYSIGNFTFGTYGRLAQTSGMFNVEVTKEEVVSMNMTGINIYNKDVHFQPTLLGEDEMQSLFDQLDGLSLPLGTELGLVEGKLVLGF